MVDAIPSNPLLRPGPAGLMLAALVLLVALSCAVATGLPHNRYIRFQQFAAGDFSRVRWDYERLHFDGMPIDVAVIGSSRLEAAVSGPKLADALSAATRRPIHVANLAVPLSGRDGNYVIAQELLRTHPEVRLVVLDHLGPVRTSHPAFRNMADWRTVVGAPVWLNYYWLDNVAYLPFRNMSLFVQSLAPRLFGMQPSFDGHYYAHYHGAAMDTTEPFRLDRGSLIDRSPMPRRRDLEAEANAVGGGGPSRLARLTHSDDNIIDDALTTRLAGQLRARCIGLVLLHMPAYKEDYVTFDLGSYQHLAPVLKPPPAIKDDWRNYANSAHLRTSGIDRITRWLPGALLPYLPPPRSRACR